MKVLVRHKTNGDGRSERAESVVRNVAHVYTDGRVKDHVGDVWDVMPFAGKNGVQYQTIKKGDNHAS